MPIFPDATSNGRGPHQTRAGEDRWPVHPEVLAMIAPMRIACPPPSPAPGCSCPGSRASVPPASGPTRSEPIGLVRPLQFEWQTAAGASVWSPGPCR